MIDLKIDLPEGFLEPETRCGYEVSAQMKGVWAVELDLFAEFARVCDKYDLRYIACGGTMLGAVRHGGFIPWDDDLDIMMMRDQYDLLLAHADEFEEPYLLQHSDSVDEYLLGHAQLRNRLTTAVLKRDLEFRRPYSQGVFIDIFPLDEIPNGKSLTAQACKVHFLKDFSVKLDRHGPSYAMRPHSLKAQISHPIMSALKKIVSYRRINSLMEKACRRFNGTDRDRVAMISFDPLEERWRMRKSVLESTRPAKFEFLEIPIPVCYDEVLSHIYGDWNSFVVDANCHGDMVIDLDVDSDTWLNAFFQEP